MDRVAGARRPLLLASQWQLLIVLLGTHTPPEGGTTNGTRRLKAELQTGQAYRLMTGCLQGRA
jgi:hypothetical protein